MTLAKSKANLGSVVDIFSWMLLVATVLAVIARLATKQVVSHRFAHDDGIALAALVWSTLQKINCLSAIP